MFQGDEYSIKQRLHDLQEGYKHYQVEQQYRSIKRKSFWKKLLRRLAGGNDQVNVKKGNNQPSIIKE